MPTLPAAEFRCVVVSKCDRCQHLVWGICPTAAAAGTAAPHAPCFAAVLDHDDGAAVTFRCPQPQCAGRVPNAVAAAAADGTPNRDGAGAAAGMGRGPSPPASVGGGGLLSSLLGLRSGGGSSGSTVAGPLCRCGASRGPEVGIWLPALLCAEEAAFGARAAAEHPTIRSEGKLAHALLLCTVCLTVSFPGVLDELVEYDPADGGTFLTSLAYPRHISAWAATHVHVQGCDGAGRADALTHYPVTVTAACFARLQEALPASLSGPLSRAAHGVTLRQAQAMHDRYRERELDRRVAQLEGAGSLAPREQPGAVVSPAPREPPAPVVSPRVPASDIYQLMAEIHGPGAWTLGGGGPAPNDADAPPPAYSVVDPLLRADQPQAQAHALVEGAHGRPPTPGFSLVHRCVDCGVRRELAAFYRCGHVVACVHCGKERQRAGRPCPICQASIVDVLRLFAPP